MPTIQQQNNSYRKLHSTPDFLPSVLASSFSSAPHLLFDCDGLLLDTEPIYSHVALLALRHFLNGCAAEDELLFPGELKMRVMGGTKSLVSQQMVGHLNSLLPAHRRPVSPEEWAEHTTPLESLHFALGCPLMPGAAELVALVRAKGLALAVATSSARETFLLKSRPHCEQVFRLFDTIVCGDDPDYSVVDVDCSQPRPIVKGKPHPSIFRTARHHLNRQPSHRGIVLEDSPNGVVAALRSGHSCIWIPAAKDCPFQVIDDILNRQVIPDGLWVYRAESLYQVIDALNRESCSQQ